MNVCRPSRDNSTCTWATVPVIATCGISCAIVGRAALGLAAAPFSTRAIHSSSVTALIVPSVSTSILKSGWKPARIAAVLGFACTPLM